jgi:hypothetical protein
MARPCGKNKIADLTRYVYGARAVPVPPEEPELVPEELGPAKMIEAAFSANAYVGSMSYNTKNQEWDAAQCRMTHMCSIEESTTLTIAVNDISRCVLSTGR